MNDSTTAPVSQASTQKPADSCRPAPRNRLESCVHAVIAVAALAILGTAASSAGAAPQIIKAALIKQPVRAIEHPKFVTPKDAVEMQTKERVVGVLLGHDAKAYPMRILRWHQVINDTIGGKAVAVTYCPLTGNTAVYERYVRGKPVIMTPADKLYESTTTFSDSATHSLWLQFDGRAISGPAKGKRQRELASINTSWGLWLAFHPRTLAMSGDTGFAINYEEDPYGIYEGPGAMQFPVSHQDQRLPRGELVLGVDVDHHAEAF